jgi:hypothetical protein
MEETDLENALVIGDPPNLLLALLCSMASRPVHLPVELYSLFLGLLPAVPNPSAGCGLRDRSQLSLVKSIPLLLSYSDLKS